MKVGLVIESLDPRRGGAEQWTWQFACWLADEGHQVHVLAGYCDPRAAARGMHFHAVGDGVGKPASRIGFARRAQGILASITLDVVHDMGYGWSCDIFQPHGGSRMAAFEQNLLLLPSGLRPLKRQAARWLPRYREFKRLQASQFDSPSRMYVALSRMVARDFERWHGVPSEQVRLVYNGVDIERFSPRHRDRYREAVRAQLAIRHDETLLLIVAHNLRLKGVHTLLAAVGRLANENHKVRLAVVGGRPDPAWLRLAHRAGALAVTHFVGPVDDTVPYYAAADIYVHPTWYDPCSLVVLEALASGLSVVTSRYNGAAELLQEGVDGRILADPSDAGELTAALRPMIDTGVHTAMGARARQLATQHTLDRNCRELVRIYHEIAWRRRNAA